MNEMDVDKAEKDIKYALKMFGEYNYHDKGTREVMDISTLEEWEESARNSNAENLTKFMKELFNRLNNNAEPFCRELVYAASETWTDEELQNY